MSNSEDTPTPTPIIEQNPGLSADKSDPESITSRYRIIDKLGQGGMGKVYSAHDATLNRPVAIKILSYEEFGPNEWIRFQREAKAASKLKHPNLIEILDFGQSEKNQPFLVMDLVEGKTLADVLKDEKFIEEEEAVNLLSQICEAMQHAHSNNVIHRDLKPSNIIILGDMENRKALVLDFGIAKILDDSKQVSTLTKTGEIVGSPRCISPEQALGEKVDQRSDIYSLGCIAFEMLTGKPVFKGANVMDTISRHLNDPAPKINAASNQEFSQSVIHAIAKALEKEPDKRFQQMSEFKESLLKRSEIEELDETNSDGTDNNQKSRKGRLITASVIAMILVGALCMMNLSEQPEKKEKKTQKSTSAQSTLNNNTLPVGLIENAEDTFNQYLQYKSGGYDSNNTVTFHNESSTEKQLARNLSEFPQAKRVWFTKVDFDENCVNLIKEFKETDSVKISNCTVREDAWRKLLEIKAIRKIQVEYSKISRTQIKLLKNNQNLNEVTFVDTGLENSALRTIATIKNLHHLNVSGNPAVSIEGVRYFKDFNKLTITISARNKLSEHEAINFAKSTSGRVRFTLTEDKPVDKKKLKPGINKGLPGQ